MSDGSAEGSEEMSMLLRLLSGVKIKNKTTLKLERREEISVEGAAAEDKFKNVVQ